jgi:hypothetical protein
MAKHPIGRGVCPLAILGVMTLETLADASYVPS